jgi:octaprenyl-diphosphate synthase
MRLSNSSALTPPPPPCYHPPMEIAPTARTSPLELTRTWLAPDLSRVDSELGNILASNLEMARQAIVELHLAGGKRIRPLLTILTNKIEPATPVPDSTIRLAAIVESLHLISLIHDDVIDEAQTRRHHTSLNFTYGNRFAVLVGDLAYARLFRTLVDHFDSHVLDYLANLVVEICSGALGENIATDNLSISEDEYYQFLNGKTASLFGAALALGTMTGDSLQHLEPAKQAGRELGMAYQIVDDILDFVGDDELGKGRFRDLPNGKITLPVIHLLASSDGRAATTVQAIIAGDATRHAELVALLQENGSIAYAQAQAQLRTERALSALAGLPRTAGWQRMAEIIRWLPIRHT